MQHTYKTCNWCRHFRDVGMLGGGRCGFWAKLYGTRGFGNPTPNWKISKEKQAKKDSFSDNLGELKKTSSCPWSDQKFPFCRSTRMGWWTAPNGKCCCRGRPSLCLLLVLDWQGIQLPPPRPPASSVSSLLGKSSKAKAAPKPWALGPEITISFMKQEWYVTSQVSTSMVCNMKVLLVFCFYCVHYRIHPSVWYHVLVTCGHFLSKDTTSFQHPVGVKKNLLVT